MEDTFGKVIAILICAVQMFIIPMYWYVENTERMEQSYIMSEITYNVDNFRNTGIISATQYENMLDRIHSLSGNYIIRVTHCMDMYKEQTDVYLDTIWYEDSIEGTLSQDGIYYLSKNDYINISVESKEGDIKYCYGGSVKNEAY